MSAAEQTASLDEFVRNVVAAAAGRSPDELTPETNVAGLLDSVTLLSVLSHVSCLYDVDVTAEETIALLEAASLDEIVALMDRIATRSPAGR